MKKRGQDYTVHNEWIQTLVDQIIYEIELSAARQQPSTGKQEMKCFISCFPVEGCSLAAESSI